MGVTVIAKPITKHTVTFVDHDDSVLKTEKVEEGKAATAPADPIRTGYTFTGWDVDFSNVTSDLMVKAKYTEDSKPVPVSAITVTGANTVVKAKTLQMGVDITPTTATNKKVIWSVIDGTGSATISSSGLLTATKVGTVTVKAVAQDGSGKEGIKEIIITAAPVTVTGVTIKTPPTKVTYIEGENLELAGLVVTLAKSDSSTEDVAFSDFGSKGITTVKANGAILGVGDTKVTISVNGQTVYQAITVNPSTVAVTGVILNKSTLNLTVGATETITATVQPTNASNKNVTWTSSDEAIATVDNTGKIEAVAVGTATITVTSVADSSKKATVEVIVLTETSEEYFVFEQATGTITGYKDEGPKNIAIPAKIDGVDVKVIGAEAFAKKELTSVVIPNSVKTIKEYAFLENKLISINIPTSVTSIGALAFTDNQLPDDQAFIYARNSDGTEDKTVVINYGGEKREDVVIPDSVVTIEEGAFASNELTSIAIPNSVTIIGKTAFAHNELLSINIPNSVTDIGEGAYQYNKLTSVMIPESVTTLGDNAFQKNGPDSESGNIPTTEFVGSWKLIGTEWERDYKLAQDTDFSGTTNGEFKYIGTDEYVEIPYEINGVPVTSYKNMFEGTSVVGVKSTKLNITSMEGMFKDSQATVLDLSDFNTSSDPNMDGMFTGSTAEKGYARTTEDADRFNASSGKPDGLTFVAKEGESYVEAVDSDFSGTEDGEFRYIGSNQYVEIPHVIKGVPVTSYYKMFEGTSVKGVKSNNENVTNMSNMFYKSQASSLDLSNFDTSNVTDMSDMFRQSQATSVDLSSFDTSNVVDMFFMFNRSQARSLDLSKFDTSKVKSMGRMFQNSQATVLDLSNFNTSNVITMEFMFDGSQANSLNLSSFDTSKVTTMNCMFKESQASSLDLSNFDTSNVTNMRSMFKNSQATVLDLSKFDTSNVTEIEEMFYGSQASTLDLSSFDTSKVKYMRDMFNGSQAASLDLSSFDTSNVTDMLDMFRESKATILDLSSFDTSKVEYTTEMFLDSKATTGYARTQIDANKFNESSEKPAGLNFVVKDAPTVPVSNIKLTPESLELTVGGELGIIIATVEPSNATNKNVTWASSDDTKATVDANGKVKGVAAGTATITVTTEDGSRTATVSVKVKGERIKINKIVATSTIDTPIHGTDVEIERPTFTVIEGSPAYFYVNSGNGWWEKKNGDNWEQVSSGTFSEGRWRFRCRVRIDGKNNTTHILDEPLVVTVNEEVWEGNYFSIGEKYSQKFVFSSEYEVTAPVYASTNTLANETITVANGSTEADAIGTLDKTVGVVGSKGETGIATIAWTITSYDGSKGGDYEATGVLTLPSGWTGTVENVTAKLTVIPEGTELIFNIGTYELPFNLVNEDITPQSVDSFVEGGTKPYKFSKISGPDWVIVSEEGEISGKPTVIGTNSDLVIRVIDAKNVQTERSIKVGKTVPKPKDRININKVVATSTIEAPIYGATIGNLASIDFEVTEGSPAYFTINRSWEKKDGDSWKKESSGTFSEGTWRFSSQVRIDKDIDGKDGTTHKLTQPFKVVVNDNNWTVEESSVLISNTYSYGIAKSSEYTVMKP